MHVREEARHGKAFEGLGHKSASCMASRSEKSGELIYYVIIWIFILAYAIVILNLLIV